MATSFRQRKALGKRYGTDPALIMEMERLQQQYNLAPGREARGMQADQFTKSMAFNKEQADINREASEKSGIMGTLGNVASMALMSNAYQGKSLLSNPFSSGTPKAVAGANTPTGANVSMTNLTPSSPNYYSATGATNPATIDAASIGGPAVSGMGVGSAAPSIYGESGTITSGAYPLETFSGAGAAEAGGASLAGAGSAALAAAPYAVGGYYAAKIGGAIGENAASKGTVPWMVSRTIQDPLGGIGKPWLRELGADNETTDTVMNILNPVGWGMESLGLSGGGAGTVVCTELHRQGLMSDETYEADKVFGNEQDIETIAGYHTWGVPLANLMRKSKLVTWVITPIALAWAEDMAGGKNIFGKILNKIGIPICRFIGRQVLEVAHG